MTDKVLSYYTDLYTRRTVTGIRRYPHEEMLRFLGRHYFNTAEDELVVDDETFFSFDRPNRKGVRILEVGCGAGSNLWAIAKEGFSTYGIDSAPDALDYCRKMLEMWGVEACLSVGDMRNLEFKNDYFNCILDIYSSFCLVQTDFETFLSEVYRTLKPGGKFFCWNPSTQSEAFINHAPAKLIEPYTLDGIKRASSPFFGNDYPSRFLTPETVKQVATKIGLEVVEIEINGRTYGNMKEYFEWLAITMMKPEKDI